MSEAQKKIEELSRHIETLEEINEGLRSSFEELSALYRLSETIASAHTFSRVISLLLDVVGEVVEYDAAMLLLYDERSQSLSSQLEKNMSPELRARVEGQKKEGLLNWALKQGRALVVPDSGAGAWTQELRGDGLRKSFILVPIVARGKPIGLLDLVVYAEEGGFSQRDLALLSILANQAGISLENARLYDNIRQDYYDVIQGLSKAVDARDHYTLEHSGRVSTYAVIIAKHMGLNSELVESIQYGALLHDVGKIGIPDLVLNKPGRLTEAEFGTMKTHSTLGANIVGKIESLVPLVPLVLYHHERFDGRGYPEGLAGKKIPLGARVINVADSFETITSDRVYHRARSFEEGLDEVLRCSGGQFDPEVVEAFVRAFAELKAAGQEDRDGRAGTGGEAP
jgi:putative nucleotidyltransferase with HDIG domain